MDEDLKMVDEDAPKVDERGSRELFLPCIKPRNGAARRPRGQREYDLHCSLKPVFLIVGPDRRRNEHYDEDRKSDVSSHDPQKFRKIAGTD